MQAAEGKKPWEADQMAYLAKMRRNGLTQPYGALLVVEPPLRHAPKLHIIGFSENASEMLQLSPDVNHHFLFLSLKILILPLVLQELALGKNAVSFFNDSTGMLLHKETLSKAGSNQPVILRLKHKPLEFYALVNRCEEGILIDLEPVIPQDPELSIAGNETILRIPNEQDPTPLTMAEARRAINPALQRLQNLPCNTKNTYVVSFYII